MESDAGKLFIGGISGDTTEVSLREYFGRFGNVLDVKIMKDKISGRARGFAFVVFEDPSVAENDVVGKHLINGRMVEAKKAFPRDDRRVLNRNSNSIRGSTPAQMRKIFVGGLPATLTNSDFGRYFEQFGAIDDAVVMYDHASRKSRGFGFITFESEEAVFKALRTPFHQLKGKPVEVKIAIPKEHAPGPSTRLSIGGNNGGLNCVDCLINGFVQLTGITNGIAPFAHSCEVRLSLEPVMSPAYSRNSSFNSGLGYRRDLSPFLSESSSSIGNPGSALISAAQSGMLGNNGLGYGTDSADSNSFMISGIRGLRVLGNNGLNFADSSSSPSTNGISSGSFIGNPNYGNGENGFGLAARSYGTNIGIGPANDSFATTANDNHTDDGVGSIFGESIWLSALSDHDRFCPFDSTDYMGGSSDSNGQMRRGDAS